jgi:plasmid stabilization system protein ParE
MSYHYIYTPAAMTEYKNALRWYQLRSIKAAENFVGTMNEKIGEICRDPLRFRNTYRNFRESSLKRYPFYIIYFVDDAKRLIVISSIYHHKRNPGKKYAGK